MTFKICMVGCGSMAQSQHGPACKMYEALHPGALFAACCDINADKAQQFKEKFGLQNCYCDINVMLETEKPDAVCMIVPENKTAVLSGMVMEKGFPIIMEKPPGLNAGETMSMIAAAKSGNTPNQVAFNRRYMPLVQKLKELLEDAGGVMDIHYRMLRVARKDADFSTTAIHGVDLVKYVAGSDYREVSFRYQAQPEWGEGVANIYLDGETQSGVVTRLEFLPVSGVTWERLEVNTRKGLFMLNLPVPRRGHDADGRLTLIESGEIKLDLDGRAVAGSDEEFVTNGFYGENASFFSDVRSGKTPAGDIASALQSVEVSECIRERRAHYSA